MRASEAKPRTRHANPNPYFNHMAGLGGVYIVRAPLPIRCRAGRMELPPAVIVHGLGEARLALAQGLPVTLLSAPGAACHAGCLWWHSLLRAARTPYPALLDCADSPGRALEALRMGLKGIVLDCEAALFAAVADPARMHGALLLSRAPPALDLASRGAARRLPAWLAGRAAS